MNRKTEEQKMAFERKNRNDHINMFAMMDEEIRVAVDRLRREVQHARRLRDVILHRTAS